MRKNALLLMAALAIGFQSQATIRRVNNTPGVNSVYASLHTAITEANPGDTIHIEGSAFYYGTPSISKKLVFIGPGYFHTDTAANPNTQANKLSAYVDMVFGPGSKGSVVQGLSLNQVVVSDSFITIQRNVITGTIYLANAGHSYGDTIRHNFMDNGGISNGSAAYEAKGVFIYNNIIVKGNGTFMNTSVLANANGFFINNSMTTIGNNTISMNVQNFTFQNNLFAKVDFGASLNANIFLNNIAKVGIPVGNNNVLNVDPVDLFVGWNSPGTSTYSTDARYKLKAGSPALNAGIMNGSPVDCGAFGGPAPYILSGMPPVPSVYLLTMPNQINSGTPSINVTVSAASH